MPGRRATKRAVEGAERTQPRPYREVLAERAARRAAEQDQDEPVTADEEQGHDAE